MGAKAGAREKCAEGGLCGLREELSTPSGLTSGALATFRVAIYLRNSVSIVLVFGLATTVTTSSCQSAFLSSES